MRPEEGKLRYSFENLHGNVRSWKYIVLVCTSAQYSSVLPYFRFTLTNSSGVQASILDYGGIITQLMVPDRDGNMGDVLLGFDNMEGQSDMITWKHDNMIT